MYKKLKKKMNNLAAYFLYVHDAIKRLSEVEKK